MAENNFLEQTVSEFLFGPCSMSLLADLARDGSEYWENAENFILDSESTKLEHLSKNQLNWLLRIKEDLLDKAR